MFLYLEKWYKYKELLEMCVFTVAFRNSTDCGEVIKMYEKLTGQGYKIGLLDNIPLEISSTDLRNMIKAGDFITCEKYISPEVLDYIKERKIYVLQ